MYVLQNNKNWFYEYVIGRIFYASKTLKRVYSNNLITYENQNTKFVIVYLN